MPTEHSSSLEVHAGELGLSPAALGALGKHWITTVEDLAGLLRYPQGRASVAKLLAPQQVDVACLAQAVERVLGPERWALCATPQRRIVLGMHCLNSSPISRPPASSLIIKTS